MKKKVLACTLAAVLSVSMLAGCGNDGNSGSSSDAGSGSTQQSSDSGADAGSTDNGGSTEVTDVALKVWCPQNQVDTGVMAEQQAAFAAAHPEWNITWTTEIVGEDNAKTEVLKDVDAAADVFLFASDQLIELVDAGAIAQLGGEAEKLVKETIADSVRATAMIGDATYAIPFTHNTFFMFYDKTIMDESDVTSLEKIMAKETADNVYNYYFESSGG